MQHINIWVYGSSKRLVARQRRRGVWYRGHFNILAGCSRNYKSASPFDGFYVQIHHRGTERTEISRKNFVFFVSLWLIELLNDKIM